MRKRIENKKIRRGRKRIVGWRGRERDGQREGRKKEREVVIHIKMSPLPHRRKSPTVKQYDPLPYLDRNIDRSPNHGLRRCHCR